MNFTLSPYNLSDSPIFLPPIPCYVDSIFTYISQDLSLKPFKKKLIHTMRKFLYHFTGKHLSAEQFSIIFTNKFIYDYIKAVGMDIVEVATNIMKNEDINGIPLGAFPITWPEAIGYALRNTSWLWHSLRMTKEEFKILYPYNFFIKYAKIKGFDKFGLNDI